MKYKTCFDCPHHEQSTYYGEEFNSEGLGCKLKQRTILGVLTPGIDYSVPTWCPLNEKEKLSVRKNQG